MSGYLKNNTGRVYNPNANSSCEFCEYTVGDEFLESINSQHHKICLFLKHIFFHKMIKSLKLNYKTFSFFFLNSQGIVMQLSFFSAFPT